LITIKYLKYTKFFCHRVVIREEKLWIYLKYKISFKNFAIERDWEQFHTPKNLAMALSVEASELVEIFQWLKAEESNSPDQRQTEEINSEVADIAMYLLRFCSVLGIDLEKAIESKLERNSEKYPVNLSKGNAQKYNQRGD